MDTKKISDAQLGELKTSNTAIREIMGAKLPIQGLKAEFDNGTLVLRGTAADQATRQQAVGIASRTPGVKRVDCLPIAIEAFAPAVERQRIVAA